MKRVLLALSLLLMLFGSANVLPIRLVRLTIVNKSGLPLEIRLTGEDSDNSYYLPRGRRGSIAAHRGGLHHHSRDIQYAALLYRIVGPGLRLQLRRGRE